jgi:hypothetical protein
MISAATGDSFDADFRKFLRQFHALVQCSVKSKTLTAPPGSPANGDAYIVGASATGAWSGHDKAIAIWTTDNPITPSGLWEFYGPIKGFGAYSEADSSVFFYDGTAWTAVGGGGGGSIGSGAGVPVGAGSVGDLSAATDGGVGDSLYSFVASKSGLPLVLNRGTAEAHGSGVTPSIMMKRNMTLGNLLIAVSFFAGGGVTQTLNTGWTSIFTDGGPTPALSAAYKVADGTEDGINTVSPWSSLSDTGGLCLFVVEVSNFDTVTPIAGNFHGSSGNTVTGLTANELILGFFCGSAPFSNGSNLEAVKRVGEIPLGMQISTAGTSSIAAYGIGVPFIPEIVGPGTITKYGFATLGSIGATCAIVVRSGAGTSHLWMPIG